jgi:hypothetical protein
MCVSDIDWDSVSTIFLHDFELFRRCGIWNCSDGVVFGIVQTAWYFELFRRRGIWNCSDGVVFGTVQTAWYLELFRRRGIWNCSDGVVFFVCFDFHLI